MCAICFKRSRQAPTADFTKEANFPFNLINITVSRRDSAKYSYLLVYSHKVFIPYRHGTSAQHKLSLLLHPLAWSSHSQNFNFGTKSTPNILCCPRRREHVCVDEDLNNQTLVVYYEAVIIFENQFFLVGLVSSFSSFNQNSVSGFCLLTLANRFFEAILFCERRLFKRQKSMKYYYFFQKHNTSK